VPLSSRSALQLAPGKAFMVRAKSNGKIFVFKKASQNHSGGVATFYKQPSTAIPTISVDLTKGTSNKSAHLELPQGMRQLLAYLPFLVKKY